MKEVTEMWPFLLDGITGVKKISCNLIILLKFLFSLLPKRFPKKMIAIARRTRDRGLQP